MGKTCSLLLNEHNAYIDKSNERLLTIITHVKSVIVDRRGGGHIYNQYRTVKIS